MLAGYGIVWFEEPLPPDDLAGYIALTRVSPVPIAGASVKLGVAIFGTIGFLEAAFAPQLLAFVSHSDLVQQAALGPMRVMGLATPFVATGMIEGPCRGSTCR